MYLLDHIKELEKTGKWNPEFQMIQIETREIVERKTLKSAKANRSLNRYRDVLPYDDSRILLKTGDHDYINANLVEVPEVKRNYILTQGPLPGTCEDFWRMAWEKRSKGIIMLNRIVEKNMIKCQPYWPMGQGEVAEFGDFQVLNESEEHVESYIIRDLLLTHLPTSESRTIKQFHYIMWPDFGVPDDPQTFLKFLADIKSSRLLDPAHPPIIHCSAGIGRSGTFCLVDACLAIAESNKSPEDIEPRTLLLSLRNYRCGLIQTVEQYRFALYSILYGYKQLFPRLFQNTKEEEVKLPEDTPPPLPPRRHPVSPKFTSEEESKRQEEKYKNITAIESSSSGDEEVINLSDLSDESEDPPPPPPTRGDKRPVPPSHTDVPNGNRDDKARSLTKNESPSPPPPQAEAIENEDTKALRQRRLEKKEKTKELVDSIKKKMSDSEKPPLWKTTWFRVGLVVTLCSTAIIVYSWMQ